MIACLRRCTMGLRRYESSQLRDSGALCVAAVINWVFRNFGAAVHVR
jgi:hypothetical protein